MASIQSENLRKGKKSYSVVWRDETGKQRRKRFSHRDHAEYFKREVESNHGWARAGNPQIPMEQFWREYLALRFAGKPQNIVKTDTYAFNQLKRFFQDNRVRYLDEINPALVQKFITKKSEDGVKVRSINRLLTHLKSSFKFAAQTYHKKYKDLYESVRLLRVRETFTPQILTLEELGTFLKNCPERYRVYFSLLAYTGMRKSEVERLQWEDIHLAKEILIVQGATKSGKLRVLGINQELKEILLKTPAEDRKGAVTGKNNNARRAFKSIIQKTGLNSKVTIHGLRHSFATAMLEVHRDLRLVQELLGHHDVKETMKYTHVIASRAVTAMKELKITS